MEKISDFLVLNLAEEIQEGDSLVQGTSTFIPMIATLLAMQKKKINLIAGFFINPKINPKVPSTFCFENYEDGKILGLSKFLDLLEEGKIDLEFLRPAQVDKFGNINNTVIGSYDKPKIRLPGGMGIDDVVHFLKKSILYIPNHNTKVFVDKVDFVTASGWDKGKGPDKIITNMCVFEFINKEIVLTKINPRYSVEDVKNNTGFVFKIADKVSNMLSVDHETQAAINGLDPYGLRSLEVKEEKKGVLEKFRFS
jgi:glutaconate CoA-transferase subunit B